MSIVYNPPVGNSVLIDKVSYGPGKIEASNESVAESNIDLPFRDAVAYIEKLVMNSSGTSSTPLTNLSVLSFVQVGGSLNEGGIDIGVGTEGTGAAVTKPAEGIARYLGYKRYELTNHLGNVLATISDYRKTSFTGSTINYFKPDVRSAQDYYPFGMLMVGRNYNTQEYPYGYNGKENDNEVKGAGNQQDYGMRTYDPRLGRFLSIDPISGQFPMLTPFQFASNSPISGIDLDGLEYLDADEARVEFKYGRLQLKVENFLRITRNLWQNYSNKMQDNNNIGADPTVGHVDFYDPNAPFYVPSKPEMKDIPGEHLPTNVKGHDEGIQSVGANRAGRRLVERGGGINVPAGKGRMTKTAILIDFINLGLEQLGGLSVAYDMGKMDEHRVYAKKVAQDMMSALEQNMVPERYLNQEAIVNIMNVILQGVNNTKDEEIYRIGMDIYNKMNHKPTYEYKEELAPADNTDTKYSKIRL